MRVLSFFKDRQLKKLDQIAISSDVLAIKSASDKEDYGQFRLLLNNASTDMFIELAHRYPELPFIQKYTREFPKKPDAHYLYGTHLVSKAWEARSKAVASKVSSEQFTAFLTFLKAAEAELYQTLRLNLRHQAVYSPLIKIQMGKSDSNTAEKIFKQANKAAPHNMDYHCERLIMLSPKWGGSGEQMFAFARQSAHADPTGILHGLIPAAHFEQWYELEGSEAGRYLKDQAVIDEVHQAYLEVENTELKDNYYSKYQYYLALNYFAVIYSLMDDKMMARKVFNMIGGHYTYRPWCNIDETPGLGYLKFKKLL